MNVKVFSIQMLQYFSQIVPKGLHFSVFHYPSPVIYVAHVLHCTSLHSSLAFLPSFLFFLPPSFHPSYTQYYLHSHNQSCCLSVLPCHPSSLPLSLPPSLSSLCFPLCLLCTLPYSLHVYLQNDAIALFVASQNVCVHVYVHVYVRVFVGSKIRGKLWKL